ncbi:MAG: septum formation initiator family protein [Pseudomonadota bacterium]
MKYAAVKSTGFLQRLGLPVACVFGIAYCVYHTLSGQFGLLALPLYQSHKAEMVERADALARDIKHVENRLALLNNQALDPDLAEELIRRDLGYVMPGDILVPVPQNESK